MEKKSKRLSTPLDKKSLRKIKKKNNLWGKARMKLISEEQETQYNKLRNQVRRKMVRKIQNNSGNIASQN